MSAGKALIKTPQGREITLIEQTPIPCFRCGVCCTCYQAPLTTEDIDNLASALGISRAKCLSRYAVKVAIKEGHVLRRTGKGCVFLARDEDGKARCTVYDSRPKACREWTPSLYRQECREGLARLKPEEQTMLLKELLPSGKQKEALHRSVQKGTPRRG